MRKIRLWITLSCCFFAVTTMASAQVVRKPGLWEMTTTMAWQKSPLPPGMTLPAGVKSPFSGTTNTTQVCLTQAMIDKYGAPMAQTQGGCKISNIVMKPTSMTADLVCSGNMNGKGEVESSWTDGSHATGKVHFEGSMQAGPNPMPIEWTVNSTSVYKGPDCGSVKPLTMPGDK